VTHRCNWHRNDGVRQAIGADNSVAEIRDHRKLLNSGEVGANLIAQSPPVRVLARGAQDVNHLDELYDSERSDILDNAYVIVKFVHSVTTRSNPEVMVNVGLWSVVIGVATHRAIDERSIVEISEFNLQT
jgi:hypothetical protein